MISFHAFVDEMCKIKTAGTVAQVGRLTNKVIKNPALATTVQPSLSKLTERGIQSNMARDTARTQAAQVLKPPTPAVTSAGTANPVQAARRAAGQQVGGDAATRQLVGTAHRANMATAQNVGATASTPAALQQSPMQEIVSRKMRNLPLSTHAQSRGVSPRVLARPQAPVTPLARPGAVPQVQAAPAPATQFANAAAAA